MMHKGEMTTSYRPDIDGLRAVAVLPVVFYHANFPGFSGGFVGVDIFFVISGYLITGIVWRELQDSSFSLTNFYVRRIKRIFPALFAMLGVCSIAAAFLFIPSDLADFGKSLSATILFYSNYNFIKVEYFDGPAIERPLLHTWSLSVEEQFYAVWPVLLFLMGKYLPLKRVLPVIVLLASILFILSDSKIGGNNQKDAFYLPHYRGWELLMGAALSISSLHFRPGRFTEAVSAVGLGAIALAVSFYGAGDPFPGMRALLPCAGALLLIATGQASTRVSRMLGWEPIRFVGQISYSLYLIHWPLFSFAHIHADGPVGLALRITLVLASFFLAYLSWHYIETPIRRAELPKRTVFFRAAPAFTVLYGIGAVFWLTNGLPFRVDERIRAIESVRRWDYSQYCRKIEVPVVHGVSCEMGDLSRGGFDFVLWGDSHANHYVPAIDTLAKSRGLRGVLLANNGCPPFFGDPATSEECRSFNASVMAWMQHQSLRFALIGGNWSGRRSELLRALALPDGVEDAGGLSASLTALDRLKIPVVILDQVPDFERNVRLCLARALMFRRAFDSCLQQPEAIFESRHKLIASYFDYLGHHHIFSVATPRDALCDGETCRAAVNGKVLMRDQHHLTLDGAIHVMPYLNIPGLSGGLIANRSAPGRSVEDSSNQPAISSVVP